MIVIIYDILDHSSGRVMLAVLCTWIPTAMALGSSSLSSRMKALSWY